MKILHTSDWHLGHRLHEQSQLTEQALFLDWLLRYIDDSKTDVLLVSGDIFDVGVPSTQAQKLYFDFIRRLYESNCHELILTGGNHDAPGTLNAPKELLDAFSVRVVGKATGNVADEVFRVTAGDETILVAAVPYLRDQDIRKAVASESAEEINNRYKTALVSHFSEVAAYCESLKTPGMQVIGMGHLFAIGGKTSESEQSIYVGGLGDIGADDFPGTFDYVALGHLHRAQKVGGRDHIRYSGSPCVLSFSEAGQYKKVIEIETGASLKISEVTVPAFRKVVRIEGPAAYCMKCLQDFENEDNELNVWAEVILSDAKEAATGYREITAFAADLRTEVLKITIRDEQKFDALKSLVDNARHVRSFTPEEVFKLKCVEMHLDLNEHPEIHQAFNEIYQTVKTQNK